MTALLKFKQPRGDKIHKIGQTQTNLRVSASPGLGQLTRLRRTLRSNNLGRHSHLDR